MPKTVALKINVQDNHLEPNIKNKSTALKQQADSLEIKRQSRILNSHINKVMRCYGLNLQAEFGSWNFISNSIGDVWTSSDSHDSTCFAGLAVLKLT